jgi:CBS domain-containing protein
MAETRENSTQGGINNKDSTSKKTDEGPLAAIAQIGQSGLALLIIVPAFILIAYMLVIQWGAVNTATQQINTMISNPIDQNTPDTISELSDFHQQTNASNQNMFAIILTVFGTWVGAVVAFYFGTQNLKQSQESFNKVQSDLGKALTTAISPAAPKVIYKTIGEMLDKEPKAKEPFTVTMNSKIREVKQEFIEAQPYNNLLVVDENEEPLGILYKEDFTGKIKAKIEETDDFDDELLGNLVKKIDKDYLVGKQWTKENGVENYATLFREDTVDAAHTKMLAKGGVQVKGVVVDEDGKVIGIVDFEMVASSALGKT